MRALPIIVLALGVAVLGVPRAHAQFAERNLRVSAAVPQDHPFGNGVAALARCTVEKTGGKMKVQGFWSAALGSDLQAVQAVRSGTIEMVVASTSPLVGLVPALGAFDLPFLFNNDAEADAVLDGPAGQSLSEKMLGTGLVNLGYWENGFRNVTNSRRPITKWEDISGLKIRVMQNNIFLDTFKNMGANAVPLAYGELYTALETKAIDGQENPFANIETAKFYEAQKYLSITQHAYTPAIILYSKRLWDQLSKDEQGVLTSCGQTAKAEERKVNRAQSQESLAKLKQHGMVVNEVSADEIARMREKAKEVYAKHASTIGPDILKLVQDQLAQIRAARR
ncbi:TRAP transporter substrate-binding protein [Xanthobacteraceae bacterium Astr-EGSB]|uniref:TRAP transporter substrate-binding protein n=1 Tax=Astrobacterium formosum TaxID=3069710 RepID=UPI0027B6B4AC|nr:TRAP transporter substrate-binding protein [Xanthobacteraceae bacterium Astr-EGSB]